MDNKLIYIIEDFSILLGDGKPVNSKEVMDQVKVLQNYLNNLFLCNDETFLGFADIYRQSEFVKNIDDIGITGTAEYIAQAIEYYCVIYKK